MPISTSDDSSKLKFLNSITSKSSETEVEHKIIVPLLQWLGYESGDWRSQVSFGNSKLDFLIYPEEFKLHCPPFLVIEVKAPGKPINRHGWQINRYMRKVGAMLGLITNGSSFQLLCRYQDQSRYQDQIVIIANYSASELVENFRLFHNLLCRATCFKVCNVILNNQQRINQKFLMRVAEAFGNQSIPALFEEQPELSSQPLQKESNSIQRRNKSMIITVFNNKGGVGKTTLTINLAASLARLGKRVLLVDIDAQANLSTGLGIDPLNDVELARKKDITHLLIDPRVKLEDVIYSKRWSHHDLQLDIIPSHIRLSRMENDLTQMVDSDRVLAKKLKNHSYDFVFIDPPPSFGKVNRISLMASNGILVPTQLSSYPIRALEYVLAQAQEVGNYKDDPLPILGVAISMYDQRSNSFNLSMLEKLKDILEKTDGGSQVSIFPEETWIPRLNIVSQCPEKGYPIQEAEFDDHLNSQEREAAQKALERYDRLASHLISSI